MNRLAFLAAFWFVTLVLPADLAQAQMVSLNQMGTMLDDTPSVTYRHLSELAGITFCVDGQPRSYANISDTIPGWEADAVRVHEAKHRQQYTRFSSCAAFDAYYRTPVGRLESEAEAYHAGACAVIREGVDSLWIQQEYAGRLYQWMGGGTPIYEITQAYKRYPCGEDQ